MNCLARNALIYSILAVGTAMAATPVEKSGDCPTLDRQPPSASDDWSQFPTKPTAEFVTNCKSASQANCTLQKPLKAAQSINCIQPATGMKVQLWASEEMAGNMKYIQHFTFDERGRLWAVEPLSYPNTIRTASGSTTDQKFVGGKDRIVILEDTDGDKVMDKFTVFRDGLNLPQSIEVVNGGVVVTMAPYVVYFPNNNDTAGAPVILYSGMGANGTFDTHGGINQIMYGLDNWIYGTSGYNNCNATGAGITGSVDCGHGKVWRFRNTKIPGMKEDKFEIWSTGFSPQQNSDGLGQTEDGQLFQSGATSSQHLYSQPVKGGAGISILTKNPDAGTATYDANDYFPITSDRYLWEGANDINAQGWVHSQNTASSNLQVYYSRLFPKQYWNKTIFSCEGASKLCNMDSLAVNGSSWKAYRLPGPTRSNIFASKDAWVAPVLARTGPDGAVWVLDWNNYLFLHNPASPGGDGGAWKNDLRVKNTNRIYRVLPTGATPEPVLNLASASEEQLIDALGSQNFFWRLTAQRILIGKATATSITKLTDILKTNKELDEVGNSPRVMHAMWALEGMGEFTKSPATYIPILQGLLKHPAWCVRRNALRAMPRTADGAAAVNTACSVNDGHAHVRLQALLAIAETTPKPTGMNPIQASYAGIDGTATTAQTASGVATGTPTCSVTLDASVPFVASTGTTANRQLAQAPREGLRFNVRAGGFLLMPHGNLPSGVLTVYDLQGRAVFSSLYDAGSASWSVASAQGLNQPVYGYAFHGADGYIQRGSIALLGAR